jgi:hypothetical protein
VAAVPVVIRAEYRGDFKVHLVFQDGTEGTVNFEEWLNGPVFEPLRDQDFFQRFFIEAGTLVWPNGADVAPETLYETAKFSAAV